MSKDHVYELRALGENVVNAYTGAGKALQEALAVMAASFSPPAVEDEQSAPDPRVFEHVDLSGDRVIFTPHHSQAGWLQVVTVEDPEVHLDQAAVNRLARYLDRHRTDLTKGPDQHRTDDEPGCGARGLHPCHDYARDGQWNRCEGQS